MDSLFLDNFVLEAREKKSSEQTTWQGCERQRTGLRQIHLGNCDVVDKLSQRMQIEKVKKNKGRKKICTSLHLEQIMCLKDFSKQQKFGEEAKKLWFKAL